MPLFQPDPTFAALQALPGRRRRGWAFGAQPPPAPDTFDGGTPSSTGTDTFNFGSPSSTGADTFDGGTP
jgi:hypothetical protein